MCLLFLMARKVGMATAGLREHHYNNSHGPCYCNGERTVAVAIEKGSSDFNIMKKGRGRWLQ